MKSLYILIGVLLLVVAFYPKITISENQIYSPVKNSSQKLSTPRINDFYIPQLTNLQKPLSADTYNNQSNANELTRNVYLNGDDLDIIRSELNDISTKYPKILSKDNLSANTIGSSELHPMSESESEPYKSYTDENASQFPKFYTSDIQNELTNVGKFFDKKIRYSDTTRSNSTANVGDNCYETSQNEIICLDNTRLQNISPRTTNNYNTCEIIKDSGNYKINTSKDSVMTGLSFYDSVFGSGKKNETYSLFSQGPVIKDCFVDA